MATGRRHRHRRRRLHFGWLVASLLITSTLAVPAAWYLIPHLQRWQRLHHLGSDDLAKREQALNYVLRLAPTDRAVRDGAIDRLGELDDDEKFAQLTYVLDQAGQWRRELVPTQPWLRWLDLRSRSGDPESRSSAAWLLADMVGSADHPRVLELLQRWLQDEHEDVRYTALIAAAELHGAAMDRRPFEAMIIAATDDASAAIARHAWLMVGILRPADGLVTPWRDVPVPVAQAMIWAALRARPERPQPAIEALSDPDVDPALRSIAAYALRYSNTAEARRALDQTLRDTLADLATLTAEQEVLLVRALLARSAEQPDEQLNSRGLITAMALQAVSEDEMPTAVAAAALNSAAEAIDNVALARLADARPVLQLAAVEALAPGAVHLQFDPDMPPLLRLASAAVTAELAPEDLRPLFASDDSAIRDQACLIAARRLSAQQHETLAADLLKDYDDHAKLAGIMLAGLTDVAPTARRLHAPPTQSATGEGEPVAPDAAGGSTVNLLEHVAALPQWPLKPMVDLAYWMQAGKASREQEQQRAAAAVALLSRPDVPHTSVLLVMLQRGRTEALDYLLAPRGESDYDYLLELFVTQRWWRVLEQYLPDDAPALSLWGDPPLQVFELEVLRDWYLLNRHRPDLLQKPLRETEEAPASNSNL